MIALRLGTKNGNMGKAYLMTLLANALQILGVVVVCATLGYVWWPAAVILGGVILVVLSLGLSRRGGER